MTLLNFNKYSLNNKNKFIINFEFDGLVSPYDLFEV